MDEIHGVLRQVPGIISYIPTRWATEAGPASGAVIRPLLLSVRSKHGGSVALGYFEKLPMSKSRRLAEVLLPYSGRRWIPKQAARRPLNLQDKCARAGAKHRLHLVVYTFDKGRTRPSQRLELAFRHLYGIWGGGRRALKHPRDHHWQGSDATLRVLSVGQIGGR